MTSGPLDVLSKLRPLTWRNIEVPCQANSVEFEHRQIDHEQHGVDGAPVETTGRKNAVYSFRIPFRVGISQYTNLYPDKFRDFWNACLDGDVGTLIHPEFGEMDAKLKSFKLHAAPEARDGYDVDVVWVETTENDKGLASADRSPLNHALTLSSDLEKLSGATSPPIEYDDGSGLSLTEAMAKLNGIVYEAQFTMQAAIGQIEGILGGINTMIDVANSVTDPNAWGLAQGLKELSRLLIETQDKLNLKSNTKRIQYVIASDEISVSKAASQASMTLERFYELNPRLALVQTIGKDREYFIEV